MGHLVHPYLCGGLLILPLLVVVGIESGCSSSSADWFPTELSAGDSVSVWSATFVVAAFGRPRLGASAIFASGANIAG